MGSMQSSAAMGGMEMGGIGEAALFLLAWTAMMVAMMVPATLPLMLLYRTIARNRLSLLRARAGVLMVLLGYIAVWALAGLPVTPTTRWPMLQGPWRRYCLPCCSSSAVPTSLRS
jgi:predicted metal-binding membrane protein